MPFQNPENTYQGIGNLGQDPEARYTPSGAYVCNFSFAVNENYTNRDGVEVEQTLWVRVAAWGKLGELCNKYLRRGSKVLVEGRPGVSAYTSGDGANAASFEVRANTVKFLTPPPGGNGAVPDEVAEADPALEIDF